MVFRSRSAERYLGIGHVRRYVAQLAIVATTVVAVAVPTSSALAAAPSAAAQSAPAAAAPAAPPSGAVCLTNASSYCLGLDPATGAVIIAAIHDGLRFIVRVLEIFVGRDNNGDPEEEEEDASTGLCMLDTGLRPGVAAHWGSCGANGTVWIWVPHNGGSYLYSRYSVDRHHPMVLTADPLSNGAALYVDVAAQPGSPFWQTFTQH